MVIKKSGVNHNFEIGIILSLVGTQISCVIMEFFGSFSFDLTNLVFLISLLLVADYHSLLKLDLKINKGMILVLGYNLYALIGAIIAGEGFFTQNQGIIYTLYVILFLLLVGTNKKDIDEDFFISAAWWITGTGSILLMWSLTDGFSNISPTGFTWTSEGSDRLTLSVLPFVNLVTLLLYKGKSQFSVLIKIIFAVVDIYLMTVCSRRGLMVAYILILIYHFWTAIKGHLTVARIVSFFRAALLILVVCIVIYHTFSDAGQMVSDYMERLALGISTYFGNFGGGVDAAAVQRNNVLNTVPKEYLNSSWNIILFGNGYGTRQLDVPYLQAFTDLGLIGGIYYLIIELFYPLQMLTVRGDSKFLKFSQYIGIMTITYNLYSGVPYNHYKFVGIILMIFAVSRFKKSRIGGYEQYLIIILHRLEEKFRLASNYGLYISVTSSLEGGR